MNVDFLRHTGAGEILSTCGRQNAERLDNPAAAEEALWDHEREQILEALGVAAGENSPRLVDALVEETKDCIEGQKDARQHCVQRGARVEMCSELLEKLALMCSSVGTFMPNNFENDRSSSQRRHG